MFEPLNRLITAVENAGLSNVVYQAINIITYVVLLTFTLLYSKKCEMKKLKALLIPLVIFPVGYIFIYLQGWASTGFQSFGKNNIVKGFVFFPIFCILLAKAMKEDKHKVLDVAALNMPLVQWISHKACIFPGCCHGYEWEHGIINYETHTYLFPNQLLESFVSFCVFLFLLLYAKKKNYSTGGKLYPLFLITFGATRFLLEFLRDNDKVVLGISNLALWALLMVLVGTAWITSIPKAEAKSIKKHHKK